MCYLPPLRDSGRGGSFSQEPDCLVGQYRPGGWILLSSLPPLPSASQGRCVCRGGARWSIELMRTTGESSNFPTELICAFIWFKPEQAPGLGNDGWKRRGFCLRGCKLVQKKKRPLPLPSPGGEWWFPSSRESGKGCPPPLWAAVET